MSQRRARILRAAARYQSRWLAADDVRAWTRWLLAHDVLERMGADGRSTE